MTSNDVDINILHLKLNALEERVKVLENTTKQLLPDDFYQAKSQSSTNPLVDEQYLFKGIM